VEQGEDLRIPILQMDPKGYDRQVARLAQLRQERDNGRVGETLRALKGAAEGTENTMPYILDAVRAYATLGEITDVFREVFGVYHEPNWI
jgi:methylmalonyl-CoA mutase N-terminal domain/subunit